MNAVVGDTKVDGRRTPQLSVSGGPPGLKSRPMPWWPGGTSFCVCASAARWPVKLFLARDPLAIMLLVKINNTPLSYLAVSHQITHVVLEPA